MSTVRRLVLGAIALSFVACTPGGTASTTPVSPSVSPSGSPSVASPTQDAASPTASAAWSPPTTPVDFRSERYGYAVTLPAGWYLRGEGPGEWSPNDLGYVGPGSDAFEEDYERRGHASDFPGITYGLYVSAATLDEPMVVEAWADKLAATTDALSSCHGEPDREPMTLAGEPGIALVYDRADCLHDHHVVILGAVHGSKGYYVMWLAKRGEDARRDEFESILSTFDWTDAS
jgi:hypothetical protein